MMLNAIKEEKETKNPYLLSCLVVHTNHALYSLRDDFLNIHSNYVYQISAGFLVGCTFALIVALALIIRARNILDKDKEGRVL